MKIDPLCPVPGPGTGQGGSELAQLSVSFVRPYSRIFRENLRVLQLSPWMSMGVQWWSSRSSDAVAAAASPKTVPHSPGILLLVTMMLFFS